MIYYFDCIFDTLEQRQQTYAKIIFTMRFNVCRRILARYTGYSKWNLSIMHLIELLINQQQRKQQQPVQRLHTSDCCRMETMLLLLLLATLNCLLSFCRVFDSGCVCSVYVWVLYYFNSIASSCNSLAAMRRQGELLRRVSKHL